MHVPIPKDAGRTPARAPARRAAARAGSLRPGSPCAGFSLIEALVVIAILGILLGVAVPGYGAWVDRHRVGSSAARLAATLGAARADAIRFASPVVLCASDDGEACGGGWDAGWLAFRDDDRDGSADAGEPVLRRDGADDSIGIGFVADDGSALARVSFDYRGYPDAAGTASLSRRDAAATVSLNRLGRVEIR